VRRFNKELKRVRARTNVIDATTAPALPNLPAAPNAPALHDVPALPAVPAVPAQRAESLRMDSGRVLQRAIITPLCGRTPYSRAERAQFMQPVKVTTKQRSHQNRLQVVQRAIITNTAGPVNNRQGQWKEYAAEGQ
jgi:hypothetical protein